VYAYKTKTTSNAVVIKFKASPERVRARITGMTRSSTNAGGRNEGVSEPEGGVAFLLGSVYRKFLRGLIIKKCPHLVKSEVDK
jgi:hypothetical protein